MEMVKNDSKTENDKVEALQTICQATQKQSEKIMTTVFDNPSQARRYTQMQDDTIMRVLKGSATQWNKDQAIHRQK